MGGHRTHYTQSNPHLATRVRHNKLTGRPAMKSDQDSPEYRRDLELTTTKYLTALVVQEHLRPRARRSSPPAEPGPQPTKTD